MVIIGEKKFTIKKIQTLEKLLIAVALYTVSILLVRLILVTEDQKMIEDRLLYFTTSQWPATLTLFLGIQYLSILTSMEHAKMVVINGMRVANEMSDVKSSKIEQKCSVDGGAGGGSSAGGVGHSKNFSLMSATSALSKKFKTVKSEIK